SSTTPETWNGDSAAGDITPARTATIVFCQDPATQPVTDFKVFKEGTWFEAVRDETAGGNIGLGLADVAFVGSRVVVDVDVSDPAANPNPEP
ncbi:MAG: hypothetical protein AAF211_05485, partial [Myxococcota bacterium]